MAAETPYQHPDDGGPSNINLFITSLVTGDRKGFERKSKETQSKSSEFVASFREINRLGSAFLTL